MIKYLFFLAVFSISTSLVLSQSQKDHRNLSNNKVALEGYDAVAYLKQNKAVEGKRSIYYDYDGARYYFYSNQNLNLFKQDPQKYLPAYGGWCAYAMGDSGEKVKVDPETFKVINGRVYLYYNFFFNNTLDSWNEYEKVLKQNADKNWNKIIQTK